MDVVIDPQAEDGCTFNLCRQLPYPQHRQVPPKSLVNAPCPFNCVMANGEPGRIVIRYHCREWAHVRCYNLQCMYRPFSVKNPLDLTLLHTLPADNATDEEIDKYNKNYALFTTMVENEKHLVDQTEFNEELTKDSELQAQKGVVCAASTSGNVIKTHAYMSKETREAASDSDIEYAPEKPKRRPGRPRRNAAAPATPPRRSYYKPKGGKRGRPKGYSPVKARLQAELARAAKSAPAAQVVDEKPTDAPLEEVKLSVGSAANSRVQFYSSLPRKRMKKLKRIKKRQNAWNISSLPNGDHVSRACLNLVSAMLTNTMQTCASQMLQIKQSPQLKQLAPTMGEQGQNEQEVKDVTNMVDKLIIKRSKMKTVNETVLESGQNASLVSETVELEDIIEQPMKKLGQKLWKKVTTKTPDKEDGETVTKAPKADMQKKPSPVKSKGRGPPKDLVKPSPAKQPALTKATSSKLKNKPEKASAEADQKENGIAVENFESKGVSKNGARSKSGGKPEKEDEPKNKVDTTTKAAATKKAADKTAAVAEEAADPVATEEAVAKEVTATAKIKAPSTKKVGAKDKKIPKNRAAPSTKKDGAKDKKTPKNHASKKKSKKHSSPDTPNTKIAIEEMKLRIQELIIGESELGKENAELSGVGTSEPEINDLSAEKVADARENPAEKVSLEKSSVGKVLEGYHETPKSRREVSSPEREARVEKVSETNEQMVDKPDKPKERKKRGRKAKLLLGAPEPEPTSSNGKVDKTSQDPPVSKNLELPPCSVVIEEMGRSASSKREETSTPSTGSTDKVPEVLSKSVVSEEDNAEMIAGSENELSPSPHGDQEPLADKMDSVKRVKRSLFYDSDEEDKDEEEVSTVAKKILKVYSSPKNGPKKSVTFNNYVDVGYYKANK